MFDSFAFLQMIEAQGIQINEPKRQNGGNSQIYFFKLDNQELVLKVYKGDEARKKTSRDRELSSYRFLNAKGFTRLPKLYEEIVISDGILLEYINGQTPTHSLKVNREILESMRQLASLFRLDSSFKDAVDACYSTEDIVSQITNRIVNLRNALNSHFDKLQDTLTLLQEREPLVLSNGTITYSMSDIGVHNTIQSEQGLKFLDLEFFGKDSAVKMIVDYLLHPGNCMTRELRSQTLEFGEDVFGIDLDLVINVTPFFAAKWATIVLRRLNAMTEEEERHKSLQDFQGYLDLAKMKDREQIHAKLLTLR
jgi:hypothetical protein